MNQETIDVRTVTSTVSGVTTIIGVLDYNGTPTRTFYHAIQAPTGADQAQINTIERQCLGRVLDQFAIWVQNNKPAG